MHNLLQNNNVRVRARDNTCVRVHNSNNPTHSTRQSPKLSRCRRVSATIQAIPAETGILRPEQNLQKSETLRVRACAIRLISCCRIAESDTTENHALAF